ncbi:MAG TPA: hypothetical protein DCW60_01890, partial [Sutterella sp.]|nr:hypothetical protein [Sutterella sp.]
NVAPQVVANHLGRVMQNEGLQAEPQALRLIGEAARGSLRDGLSLLDQAVAYVGSDPVTLKSVREMLGIMDGDVLTELLKKIAAEDAAGVMRTADDMAASGVSFGEALKDLASLLHRIAIAQKVPEALSREDLDYADIRTLASAFTPEEIQLFYQIALHGKADLHLAPDEYAGFTMTLLRMLAFKPQGSALSAKARVATSEKQPPFEDAAQGQKPSGGDIQPAPKAPAEPRPVKKVEPSPELKTPPRAREVKKEVPPKAAEVEAPEVEAPEVDIPEDEFLQDTVPEDFEYGFSDMAPAQSDFEPAVSAPVETVEEKLPDAFDDENRVFSELGKIWFEKMGRTFPASFTRDIIENAELLQLDASTLTLRLEPFYESRTKNPATMRLLHKIVDSAFGQQMTIRFEWSAPMSRTIAQEKRAARKAATKEVELSNEERTRAQAILKGSAQAKILARRFNAKIAPETIRKQ